MASRKYKINTELPVVDLVDAVDLESQRRVGKQLIESIENIGFFYVVGHRIDQTLVDRAFESARAFFNLSEEHKARVTVNRSQRGWMRQGLTRLEGSANTDVKEVFFWGREISENDPEIRQNLPLVALNQWPDDSLPGFKRDVLAYYSEVMALGRLLLTCIALGLNQNPAVFHRQYSKPLGRGQLVYYPPITKADMANDAYSAAPHTDFGVLTILLQDSLGGLQAKHQNGDWVDVPPIEKSFICNIGDLLERWTNGRLPSTIHRVLNSSGKERLSIPIFFDPDSDAVIDPKDFKLSQNQTTLPPVRAGEYIAGKNRQNFLHYK